MISQKDLSALKIVIESRGVNPSLKKSLREIYVEIGGNIDDIKDRTGKGSDRPLKGDQGDTYNYRVRRG